MESSMTCTRRSGQPFSGPSRRAVSPIVWTNLRRLVSSRGEAFSAPRRGAILSRTSFENSTAIWSGPFAPSAATEPCGFTATSSGRRPKPKLPTAPRIIRSSRLQLNSCLPPPWTVNFTLLILFCPPSSLSPSLAAPCSKLGLYFIPNRYFVKIKKRRQLSSTPRITSRTNLGLCPTSLVVLRLLGFKILGALHSQRELGPGPSARDLV